LTSKYVSLASIISCSVAAALILVQRLDFTYLMPYNMTDAPYDYWIFVMCGFYLLAAALVTIRHKGNISRLIKHTESKVFVKKHASSK
jgi:glycerol-3-phosphate acyltransferase PlsY